MSISTFTDRFKTLKTKLPSAYTLLDMILDMILAFFRELFLVIHIFLELTFNLFIIYCALMLFNAGIDLYMLRNGGNISKVVIDMISYLAFIISAVVVKNIIFRNNSFYYRHRYGRKSRL